MTPTPTPAPTRSFSEPQGSYPFAAFALQATLGVRLPPSSTPERGGSA